MTSLSGCSIRATRWGKVTVMGANAQTTVQKFLSGAVLTAEQQNTSAATGVPVFATTVTRDAAFGGANKVLAEGQTCYLESTNVVQYYDGAAWATVGPTAAPTSGLVVVKAETAFTSVSNITVDSVFTSSYTNYKVLLTLTISSGFAEIGYQNRVGGVTAAGANYTWQQFWASGTTPATTGATSTTTNTLIYIDNTAQVSLDLTIYAPQLAKPTNIFNSQATGLAVFRSSSAIHTLSTAYDGFILTNLSNNFTGTYTVYGYGKTL